MQRKDIEVGRVYAYRRNASADPVEVVIEAVLVCPSPDSAGDCEKYDRFRLAFQATYGMPLPSWVDYRTTIVAARRVSGAGSLLFVPSRCIGPRAANPQRTTP